MSATFSEQSATSVDTENGHEWAIRLYREGDIPGIVALLNAANAVDRPGETISEEEMGRRLSMPLSDPPRQVILVQSATGGGAFQGYGRVQNYHDQEAGERIYQIGLRVHPAARDKGLERVIATRLIEMARANESSPDTAPAERVVVMAGAREEDTGIRAQFSAMGLPEVRQGWIMIRSLEEPVAEPQPVDGVVFRNYRRPEDNERTLHAYNNSFIDHFEFHALPQEMWDYIMDAPDTRVDLSWLAEVEPEPGTIAGFCICDVKSEDNARTGRSEGWIDMLGTVRGWRGKGLGRSLLLHGLRSLQSAGVKTALLGVDSESPTGANRLYESVGFTVRDHEIIYKLPLSEVKV
jgi:mycothiol synthase